MSETNHTGEAPPRRGVPIWVQAVVLVFLLLLLTMAALGLTKMQQGAVKTGDTISGFNLTFFDGYTQQSKKEVSLADLKGKVVVIKLLGIVVYSL